MTIKSLTLNIWNGGILMNNILEFLKKESPDIVMLQEVYNGPSTSSEQRFQSLEFFKRNLGLPHFAFSPAFFDTRSNINIDTGNAVFTRFPIIKNESIFYDVPYGFYDHDLNSPHTFEQSPRVLQHTTLVIENKEIDVFNNHGIWGKNGHDNERRFMMSQKIIDSIKDKERVILAGDFNMSYETEAILNIEKHLKNVFKGELRCTFNMKHKIDPGYALAAVDMMFVSPQLKIIDHYCPQVDVSDHLPLVTILEV